MSEKRFYEVCFKIGEFWHSNIAHSDSVEKVNKYYSKYEQHGTYNIDDSILAHTLSEARCKGKPIVEI